MTDAVTIYHKPTLLEEPRNAEPAAEPRHRSNRWCFISTHRRMPIRCVSCCSCWVWRAPASSCARRRICTNRSILADQALSDAALIQAMVDNPKLIERPIVVSRGQARIGRPPEQVLEIVS
ncbi:Arsenate reductase [Klebsiella variicola]|uniref:Arsenate reductase n=1 Tax=Klebsiella variicola TaxID=244366 RepID=A0A7H4MQ75_KLEVA|nr:Arsenate reductase [Klebsiella variicola]